MIRSAYQAQQVIDDKPPNYFAIIHRTMVALVTTAVFVIVFVAFWFFTATGLRTGMEDWASSARATGWAVEYKQAVLSGFPFAIRLTLKNPHIASDTENPGWGWIGPELVVQIRPWNPGRFNLIFPNRHKLELNSKGKQNLYAGSSRELTVEYKPGKHWPTDLLIQARDLALQNSKGQTLGARIATLKATNDPSKPEDIKFPSTIFNITAKNLSLPGHIKLPMGQRVSKLSVNAAVMGGIEKNPLRMSLTNWRDAGGTLEIPKFSMNYGPLSVIRSDGTVALDGNLQPVGAFTAKLKGFFEIVDALHAVGWISGKDSVTAKLVTGAFFQKDENGGPPSLNLAISIQDQKIYTSQVKLADMPPISWGTHTNTESGTTPN